MLNMNALIYAGTILLVFLTIGIWGCAYQQVQNRHVQCMKALDTKDMATIILQCGQPPRRSY